MSTQATNIRSDWGQFKAATSVTYDGMRSVETPYVRALSTLTTSEKLVAIAEIERLATLERDWDGYDGLPISVETRQAAIRAIVGLPDDLPMPELSPTSNGTIALDWSSAFASAYLEIGRSKYSFFIKLNAGNPLLVDGKTDSFAGIGEAVLNCVYPSAPASSLQMMVVAFEPVRYSTARRW